MKIKQDDSTMDNVMPEDMSGPKDQDMGNDMSYIKEFVDGLDPDELAYLKTCIEGMTDAKQPEDDLVGAFAKAKSGERSEPNSQSQAGSDLNSPVNDEGELD